MRFLVTTKCRANGRHVAAGEILDASNSDVSTIKALADAGRGRYIADEEKPAPPAPKPEPPASTAPPLPEPTVGSEPEATEPPKKRGRPRKE